MLARHPKVVNDEVYLEFIQYTLGGGPLSKYENMRNLPQEQSWKGMKDETPVKQLRIKNNFKQIIVAGEDRKAQWFG